MSDWRPGVRGILCGWLAEHLVEKQEELIKYESGPAIHAARAEAHALAAMALHRALEGEGGV